MSVNVGAADERLALGGACGGMPNALSPSSVARDGEEIGRRLTTPLNRPWVDDGPRNLAAAVE